MLGLRRVLVSHANVLAEVAGQAFIKDRRPAEPPLGLAAARAHQVRGLGMVPLELPPLGHLKAAHYRLVGLEFICHLNESSVFAPRNRKRGMIAMESECV